MVLGILDVSVDEFLKKAKSGELNVCVIGTGRIGLPMAVVLAESGMSVIGVDINHEIVTLVNRGIPPIDEPGLEKPLKKVIKNGKFKAITNLSSAVKDADIIIICVPTPVDEAKNPDYSAIKEASEKLAKVIKKGSLIIVESTVAPGTVENLVIPLLESKGLKAHIDFGVVSCPERLNPGQIMRSLKSIPRIVGGIDEKSVNLAAAFYETALNVKVIKVRDPKTANAVKLTENIFRDVNIALMNELAILNEKLGIDTIEVIKAASTKWNFVPHYPGVGVGGPCLPANSYYLIQEAQKVGYIPYIVRLAREINDRMPEHAVARIMEALNKVNKKVKGSKVTILGVTYKPGVCDVRNTPVEYVIRRLQRLGAEIACYDPCYKGEKLYDVFLANSLNEAVKNADCVVLCTAHKEFLNLDFSFLAQLVSSPAAFVDTRGVVDADVNRKAGFIFRGIGRN